MDDCCGICCIFVTCFGEAFQFARRLAMRTHGEESGLVASACAYLPFQSVCKGRGCCRRRKDEDDLDEIAIPEADPAFTPSEERVRAYTLPLPMRVQQPVFDSPTPTPLRNAEFSSYIPPSARMVDPPRPDYRTAAEERRVYASKPMGQDTQRTAGDC
jgi:hypothetical protein